VVDRDVVDRGVVDRDVVERDVVERAAGDRPGAVRDDDTRAPATRLEEPFDADEIFAVEVFFDDPLAVGWDRRRCPSASRMARDDHGATSSSMSPNSPSTKASPSNVSS
jgi:hypothetical protein